MAVCRQCDTKVFVLSLLFNYFLVISTFPAFLLSSKTKIQNDKFKFGFHGSFINLGVVLVIEIVIMDKDELGYLEKELNGRYEEEMKLIEEMFQDRERWIMGSVDIRKCDFNSHYNVGRSRMERDRITSRKRS